MVTLNGLMTIADRKNAVEQFNDPAGPRIMIISGVGMIGLNLPVANILIMIRCTRHLHGLAAPAFFKKLLESALGVPAAANFPSVYVERLMADPTVINVGFSSANSANMFIGQ
ncbi:hypothetical protein B0H13DRAFT_1850395 [Mycena leptocephala]|nr:hypothetical protein B0H13DRAFT_1850395 [Mycena leptocephala]